MKREILLLIVLSLSALQVVAFTPPGLVRPRFEALFPKGLRLSVRDNDFTSLTFTGNLQNATVTKQWNNSVPKTLDGDRVFLDRSVDLKLGNTISYKLYFVKDGIRYQIHGDWAVTEFVLDDTDSCKVSETSRLCPEKLCKRNMIFEEQFESPFKFNWQIEEMFPQEPDYPFNAYAQKNVQMSNGKLKIKCSSKSSKDDQIWNIGYACTGEAGTRECKQVPSGSQILPPVVCGKVTTRKLFNFKYGYIEIRAKLPAGDWIIPEITLEPLYHKYGRQDYGSGIIRIAYLRGNQAYSNELFGGLVLTAKEPYRSAFSISKKKASGNWNDGFHTYTLAWKPDGIQLAVDNKLYGNVSLNKDVTESNMREVPHSKMWRRGSHMAPFDDLFYISLGLCVGGINDFPDSPEKPWKNDENKAMYKFAESKHLWYRTWTSPTLEVDHIFVNSL